MAQEIYSFHLPGTRVFSSNTTLTQVINFVLVTLRMWSLYTTPWWLNTQSSILANSRTQSIATRFEKHATSWATSMLPPTLTSHFCSRYLYMDWNSDIPCWFLSPDRLSPPLIQGTRLHRVVDIGMLGVTDYCHCSSRSVHGSATLLPLMVASACLACCSSGIHGARAPAEMAAGTASSLNDIDIKAWSPATNSVHVMIYTVV